MAEIKSDIKTTLDVGDAVRPNEYLGNVQHIDLAFSTSSNATADTLVFSNTLPQNARVVAVRIDATAVDNTDVKLEVGVTGDSDALIAATDVGTVLEFIGNVSASELAIIGAFSGVNNPADGAVTGYALIVTDQ